MVLDAILPELFAAIIGVHMEPNCALVCFSVLWSQLNIEPLPLVGDLLNVKPVCVCVCLCAYVCVCACVRVDVHV